MYLLSLYEEVLIFFGKLSWRADKTNLCKTSHHEALNCVKNITYIILVTCTGKRSLGFSPLEFDLSTNVIQNLSVY